MPTDGCRAGALHRSLTRGRDLELRIDSLELASNDEVSYAGYTGCDTNCGDGCNSYGLSCGGSSNC